MNPEKKRPHMLGSFCFKPLIQIVCCLNDNQFITINSFSLHLLNKISVMKLQLFKSRTLVLLLMGISIVPIQIQSQNATMKNYLSYRDAVQKANELLSQMTIDEKIKLIGGTEFFYSQEIPRLGIPKIMMTDATGGLHLRDEFMGIRYKNAMVVFTKLCLSYFFL
jgi:hypothetical protein